jgi:hypothetical protein
MKEGASSGPLQKRDTFQRSKRTVELRSVCCLSTGIRSEQSSEASSAWWPNLKVALALPLFALNRLAKSLGCCDARVGALAMSGIGDGEESWSEDDLFDLDSALSFGARIEEIAVFLRRRSTKGLRMQSAEFCKAWADSAKHTEQPQGRFRETSCGLVRGTKASIGGREKSTARSGRQPPSPRRSDSRGNAQQIG